VLAVVLAVVGVLATMSTFVAERRRELAIQSALGASPARLVGAVAGQGLELTAAGLVVGVGLGAAAAKSLSSLLYGVGPYDVATFAGTALLIGAGATVTAYLSAARAGRIDPLVALKSD
jgi:ABC-type antimicrobial peptide transport system permease subunit